MFRWNGGYHILLSLSFLLLFLLVKFILSVGIKAYAHKILPTYKLTLQIAKNSIIEVTILIKIFKHIKYLSIILFSFFFRVAKLYYFHNEQLALLGGNPHFCSFTQYSHLKIWYMQSTQLDVVTHLDSQLITMIAMHQSKFKILWKCRFLSAHLCSGSFDRRLASKPVIYFCAA